MLSGWVHTTRASSERAGDAPNFTSDSMEYLIGVRPGPSKPDASLLGEEHCVNVSMRDPDSINDEGLSRFCGFFPLRLRA